MCLLDQKKKNTTKSTSNLALLLRSLFIWSYKGECGHTYEGSTLHGYKTGVYREKGMSA